MVGERGLGEKRGRQLCLELLHTATALVNMGRKTHDPGQLLKPHSHGSPCLTWPYFWLLRGFYRGHQAKPLGGKLGAHSHLASPECKTPGHSASEVPSLSSYLASSQALGMQMAAAPGDTVWGVVLTALKVYEAEGGWPALSTSAPKHTAKVRGARCLGPGPSSPDPLAVSQQRNSSGRVLGPQGRSNGVKGSPATQCFCQT